MTKERDDIDAIVLRLDAIDRRIIAIADTLEPEEIVIDASKISDTEMERRIEELQRRHATHPMQLVGLEDLNTDKIRRLVDIARSLGEAWRTSVHGHGDADTDRLCDEIAEITRP